MRMSKKDKKETVAEEQKTDQVIQEPNGEKTLEEIENEAAEAEEPIGEGDLGVLIKENEELKDKYLRLFAEFDNFKKRTLKEKLELMKTAAQDTVSALLPVLDDFDRAKKNAEDANTQEAFSEGVLLVYNKLYSVLRQLGLEPMESNERSFDPELHEAITEIPAPSESMKGMVIDTIEKGYFLKGKLIRHAKVVVGK